VELVEENEHQVWVFVLDPKHGRMMIRISDRRMYPGEHDGVTEQLGCANADSDLTIP
jgi:hypothetical protein